MASIVSFSYGRLGIFLGFASFFFMEKTLRVLSGDSENISHSHSHSHSADKAETRLVTGIDGDGITSGGLRERKVVKTEVPEEQAKAGSGPSKLSAYLNLFGDFVHNMCVDFSTIG